MRSNAELTGIEFVISLDIKRALNALGNKDISEVKNYLYSALANLHR